MTVWANTEKQQSVFCELKKGLCHSGKAERTLDFAFMSYTVISWPSEGLEHVQ